jgi:integrase
MIFSVYKRRRKKNGKTVLDRCYTGKYSIESGDKPKTVALGVSDKQVAEEKLKRIVREEQRAAVGLAPTREQREAAQKPYLEHVQDFIGDLKARGKNRLYVKNTEGCLTRLAEKCGWHLLRDVTPDSFVSWRSRQNKLAPKTLKAYQDDVRNFFNWLVQQRRYPFNPLAGVEPVRTRGRETYKRRALSEDEIPKLLAVAGDDRELYMTAIYTGLRKNELRQLVWGDLHLDVEKPYVRVRASTTKNGESASLPLIPQLVEALQKKRPLDFDPGDRVFYVRTRLDKYRKDLKKAGIPYVDKLGRVVDIHALRHTFGTLLAKWGLPPQQTQRLMRHSDIKMTMEFYTDLSQLPISNSVEFFKWFGDELGTLIGTQKSCLSSLAVSSSDTENLSPKKSQVPASVAQRHAVTHSVADSPLKKEWWAQQDYVLWTDVGEGLVFQGIGRDFSGIDHVEQ